MTTDRFEFRVVGRARIADVSAENRVARTGGHPPVRVVSLRRPRISYTRTWKDVYNVFNMHTCIYLCARLLYIIQRRPRVDFRATLKSI